MTTHSALPGRLAALCLIGQLALMQATITVLGGAINWPASLHDPASVALPRLVDHEGEVLFGYGCYMVAALLFVPATAALNARLNVKAGMAGLLIALAAMSAIAKAIGIGRWLFVMPSLAHVYVAAQTDQATLGLIFEAINAFAGGIGEVLGVGLIGALWTVGLALILLTSAGRIAKGIGAVLLVGAAALLAAASTHFGINLGPSMLMISNVIWQIGLLALGLWTLFAPRAA